MNPLFWNKKRVFITGHTGFKGSWLSHWLDAHGATLIGYSLPPPTSPNLFSVLGLESRMESHIADIRDGDALKKTIAQAKPDVVIHLAAQSLVRHSYQHPVDTYSTNVMGTVNVLEAIRGIDSVRAVVNITTDKCYENREWLWGYRENDSMGGFDPYSSSKGCAELVTSAYRNSFFPPNKYSEHGVAIASARAGNVIGGGDWGQDRLIPDILSAMQNAQAVTIRSPHAIRPWQHVLEPLNGYLTLAENLCAHGTDYAEAWNFGSHDDDARPVQWIVEYLTHNWGENAGWQLEGDPQPHEASSLTLDCTKARRRLNWKPVWTLEHALDSIIEWHKSHIMCGDMKTITSRQISDYETTTA